MNTSPTTDLLALGEVMVRLSPPGHGRLEFARTLEVDVGGGDYNVAYACARFGLRAGFVTSLPDNEVARIIRAHAGAVGLDLRHTVYGPYDGVGKNGRVGLYFAEIGVGPRGGTAMFDRGHSSASRMKPDDVDWDRVFTGCRWFHCGGIFPVLSESCRTTLRAAVDAARRLGVGFSYDLNFRSKLCTPAQAAEVNREFSAQADLLLGSAEGFAALLGMAPTGMDERALVDGLSAAFPRLRSVAATKRTVRSGSRHDLGGWLWRDGELLAGRGWHDVEIEDRIGSGDAFAAGILFGHLTGRRRESTLALALAHAALVHTTRGDTSQFTLEEVERAASEDVSALQR